MKEESEYSTLSHKETPFPFADVYISLLASLSPLEAVWLIARQHFLWGGRCSYGLKEDVISHYVSFQSEANPLIVIKIYMRNP
ncbi:hypothetical protein D7Z54_20280 [Salibacterium salarium]|uniref:Uncharacterized protein n=1 Tax=Salibacterium salarium TaxID=284579 RepID=A0A3R9QIP3_9BACI|nr:hypothetical protein D7Z54_20280 [Salibacterium salarium]